MKIFSCLTAVSTETGSNLRVLVSMYFCLILSVLALFKNFSNGSCNFPDLARLLVKQKIVKLLLIGVPF